jgi:hypothetical protein
MFVSKWRLIGFVLYVALRVAVGYPLPVAAAFTRRVIERRIEALEPVPTLSPLRSRPYGAGAESRTNRGQ